MLLLTNLNETLLPGACAPLDPLIRLRGALRSLATRPPAGSQNPHTITAPRAPGPERFPLGLRPLRYFFSREYMRTALELPSGKRELVEMGSLDGVRSPRGLPAGGCARRTSSLALYLPCQLTQLTPFVCVCHPAIFNVSYLCVTIPLDLLLFDILTETLTV